MGYLLFVALFLLSANTTRCEDELLSVVAIIRHGERVMTRTYPLDPYKDPKLWPADFGQLINKGKERMYNLGKWFRSRYSDFLPETYSAQDFYAFSTDRDRTLMSGSATMAGLYPPTEQQKWHPEIQWNPVPVHSIPAELDNVLGMDKSCPKHEQLQEELMQSPVYRTMNKNNAEFYKFLNESTGLKIKTFLDVKPLFSILKIQEEFNLTLPKWSKGLYPEKLRPFAMLKYLFPSHTPEMARLYAGPLLGEIRDHFNGHVGFNTTQRFRRKLVMYFGHHGTVITFLKHIGAFYDIVPEYADTILIELRRNDKGVAYVAMYYKDFDGLKNVTLNQCSSPECNYETFLAIIKPLAIDKDEWEVECLNVTEGDKENTANK